MKFKPKFKKFGKLPGQPSKLIRIALADLEKVEKSPNYVIDMGRWHDPNVIDGKCLVCLAGSVIAGTLGHYSNHHLFPDYFEEQWALRALDCMRRGDIRSAFDCLDLGDEFDVTRVDVPEDIRTYKDKAAFKKYLNTLADSLESQGF